MSDEPDSERDDKPENVIPINRKALNGSSRPYLEPPERHREVASVSKLLNMQGQPSGRVGVWFFIRNYPGVALTPTQARALGQLLMMAADDVEATEPLDPEPRR